jgi:hypothetical protein
MGDSIALWVHGHSHAAVDYNIAGIGQWQVLETWTFWPPPRRPAHRTQSPNLLQRKAD